MALLYTNILFLISCNIIMQSYMQYLNKNFVTFNYAN